MSLPMLLGPINCASHATPRHAVRRCRLSSAALRACCNATSMEQRMRCAACECVCMCTACALRHRCYDDSVAQSRTGQREGTCRRWSRRRQAAQSAASRVGCMPRATCVVCHVSCAALHTECTCRRLSGGQHGIGGSTSGRCHTCARIACEVSLKVRRIQRGNKASQAPERACGDLSTHAPFTDVFGRFIAAYPHVEDVVVPVLGQQPAVRSERCPVSARNGTRAIG
jgi:hypothetical protein